MIRKAKDYLDRLVSFQEEDGYLGVYLPEDRFRFDTGRTGELWTQSRIMLILLAGFDTTTDEKYFHAADRMATCILKAFSSDGHQRSFFAVPDADGSKTHGLMIIEPMLRLNSISGRNDVVYFCENLYIDYSEHDAIFPGIDCRLTNLLDPAIPFVGHGPHTCEQMRIPLLLYRHTGKNVYLDAFNAGVQKLEKYLALSGSCKSDELIGTYPADLPEDQRTNSRLLEVIPLPSHGYEYCSTTELSKTWLAALSLTGYLQYADREEWLVFNAGMAARQADGKAIEYLCADNLYAATRQAGERWDYSPTHTDAAVCCAPNSGRIMPDFLQNMWVRDSARGSLKALLYGPCEVEFSLENGKVRIVEGTRYPFEKDVRLHLRMESDQAMPFEFRIPRWATGFEIFITQKATEYRIEKAGEGRFAVVERIWQDGDEILLRMDWRPVSHRAVDGTCAVSNGPLLYSLNIPAEKEDYFSYPLEDFHDSNYTPQPDSQWDYTFQFEENEAPGKYFTAIDRLGKNDEKKYEWQHPPVALKAEVIAPDSQVKEIQLVPIGCTTLRRTAFPRVIKTDQEGMKT